MNRLTDPLKIDVKAWFLLVPIAACCALPLVLGRDLGAGLLTAVGLLMLASVVVAVHHAEVIALRVGEPFGTLVLALAITVIETSLIVALMISGGSEAVSLARDTVYATVMIICNGVVGLCLLAGASKHRVLEFRVEGTAPALTTLAALAGLVLMLPSFTSSTPGPTLSQIQLAFAAVTTLTLYGVFVFVQTVRHREYFLPPQGQEGEPAAMAPPTGRATLTSLALLLLSLVAVVGLAKALAPSIKKVVANNGAPQLVVGIAVAFMVLLPETWAATRAALKNRMQTSFNLALGSALASIGLTIPAVIATAIYLELPLVLGLAPKDLVLLALTLFVSGMTLSGAGGRATVLQGAVHLLLFFVFLFLTVFP